MSNGYDDQDYSGYYAANGIARKQPVVAPDEFDEPDVPEGKGDDQWFVTALLAIVVFTVSFGLFTFVEPPIHTYAPPKVYYSFMELAMNNMSGNMIESKRGDYLEKHGIDFSSLMTPVVSEQSKAMKAVAGKCLADKKTLNRVLPIKAHAAFALASDYMVCVMQTDVGRLCSADERQRLVAQLNRYLELREHVLAVERSLEKMMSSRGAKFSMNMHQKFAAPSVQRNFPKIGTDLDGRITENVRKLSEKGYLFPEDFGWMGLVLPRAYAPYLTSGAGQPAACAG